jgi:HEAT repeat protein
MVLAELLDSHDPTVRQSAVRLIGWSGDVRLSSRLLELLDHDELRQEAAAGLIGFGPEAAKTLMALWPDASQRMRTYMAYIFAETGCVAALGLLESALTASDSELRMTALQALGRLGGVQQLPVLVPLLDDETPEVGEAAVQAICYLGERFREQAVAALAPQLVAEQPAVRMRVVQILSRLGGAGIEHYLAFALKDESALVRRAAVRACEGQSGESQIQSLMLALTDEDNEVRRLAAEALGSSANLQVLRPLELALRDEDIWVRSAAVRALGRVGRGDAVAVIEGALRDPVGLVIIAALETLAEIAPERAILRMVELLHHDDEEVVTVALKLLSASGSTDWIDGVVDSLLNHRHWEVRATFARIFAEARGRASCGKLEERLLVEGEELVRQQLRDLLVWLQEL